jgi:hypothetical protein
MTTLMTLGTVESISLDLKRGRHGGLGDPPSYDLKNASLRLSTT